MQLVRQVSVNGKLAIVAALAGACSPAFSAVLRPETVHAWQEYVQAADRRTQVQPDSGRPFLWIDQNPERRARVQRGEVVIEPVAGRGTKDAPNGLIHDWLGGIFIPNATAEGVLGVLDDYDRYRDIYKPVVTDSRSLGSTDCGSEFSMTWERRVLFVNAGMQGWYRSREFPVDSRRGYAIADATRIQQIEERNHVKQLLPPDTGSGYLWRLHSITKYEQRDGGVYLEVEALALSRDIPASVKWLVTPVVNRMSISSLETTLKQTRDAVEQARNAPTRQAANQRSRAK
jgi:hypothetical protein